MGPSAVVDKCIAQKISCNDRSSSAEASIREGVAKPNYLFKYIVNDSDCSKPLHEVIFVFLYSRREPKKA